MDFAVQADHWAKLKESQKRDQYLNLAKEVKKTMEHESDGDTSCNWYARYSHQRTDKGTGGFGNKRTCGDHPNDIIVKNDQNTEKSPGDLRSLAVTQTPVWNHHLALVGKTPQNISHQKTWTWQRKGNLKRETESLLIAAQDNAIRTNHIKARIDKTQQNRKCRLCGDRVETINHIISKFSKFSKFAQKEYKARHDWVGKVIHWEMCKKFKFDHTDKWYMHNRAPCPRKWHS